MERIVRTDCEWSSGPPGSLYCGVYILCYSFERTHSGSSGYIYQAELSLVLKDRREAADGDTLSVSSRTSLRGASRELHRIHSVYHGLLLLFGTLVRRSEQSANVPAAWRHGRL